MKSDDRVNENQPVPGNKRTHITGLDAVPKSPKIKQEVLKGVSKSGGRSTTVYTVWLGWGGGGDKE